VTHPLASGAVGVPAAGGRPQAAESDLSVLFRRHHAGLVRLAVLLVGDQETAEDVVQDVFTRLHARGMWRDRAAGPDRNLAYIRADELSMINTSACNATRSIPPQTPSTSG
jgi:Sigma-70 region 2